MTRIVYSTSTPEIRWCGVDGCGYIVRPPATRCPLHQEAEQ